MAILDITDLAPFADIEESKALLMIADAEAMAAQAAPCITTPEFLDDSTKVAQARALLRNAVLRWNDIGSGAHTQRSETAGSVTHAESYDTRALRRGLFWPSEIAQLSALCADSSKVSEAYSIDTAPTRNVRHLPYCDLMFLGDSCSCGVNLTGGEFPLYGYGVG